MSKRFEKDKQYHSKDAKKPAAKAAAPKAKKAADKKPAATVKMATPKKAKKKNNKKTSVKKITWKKIKLIEQHKDPPIVQEYDVPVFLILLLYVKDGYRKSTNTVCTKAVTMLWQCYKD